MDAVQAANSGPPGHADGAGAGRLPAVAAPPALRPRAAGLGQPGPVRAVRRARFDAAVLDAAPGRGEVGERRLRDVGEPAVSLEDLKRFRQLDSKCPGHPEYRWTSGVECTTGPLGTGIATSVGMAIAGLWHAATFNRPGYELFDYDVYALAGDGCLMEGIGAEAASLAGHLKLDNLCWIYDNNRITIEGATSLAFSEDVRDPVRRLRLGDPPRHRRQRPGRAERRVRRLQGRDRAPDADHRRQHHRLRRADQAGHALRARRAAGRGRGQGRPSGSTAGRRTRRSGCRTEVARARRGPGWPSAAGGCGGSGRQLFARYAARVPGAGRAAQPHAAAHPARRLGRRHPDLRRRRQGRGRPRRQRQGAQRGRRPGAVADRRLLGPGPVEQVPADLRRAPGTSPPRTGPGATCTSGCASTPRPRSPTGWRCRKLRAYQAGFLIFSDFQRGRVAAVRADGAAADPRLHARLDRGRRGRPDAPADRAPGLAAGHARRDRHAARPTATRWPRPGGC